MGDVDREYESDYANYVLNPEPEDFLGLVDDERKREKESGENPHYGPGNPDWERDAAKTAAPSCDCQAIDLPPVPPDNECPICRRPKDA